MRLRIGPQAGVFGGVCTDGIPPCGRIRTGVLSCLYPEPVVSLGVTIDARHSIVFEYSQLRSVLGSDVADTGRLWRRR